LITPHIAAIAIGHYAAITPLPRRQLINAAIDAVIS
jgi:hypothetical protein